MHSCEDLSLRLEVSYVTECGLCHDRITSYLSCSREHLIQSAYNILLFADRVWNDLALNLVQILLYFSR